MKSTEGLTAVNDERYFGVNSYNDEIIDLLSDLFCILRWSMTKFVLNLTGIKSSIFS